MFTIGIRASLRFSFSFELSSFGALNRILPINCVGEFDILQKIIGDVYSIYSTSHVTFIKSYENIYG